MPYPRLARLALVFHCIRHAYLPGPDDRANLVAVDTLENALALTEWFKNEARRIYYTMGNHGDTTQADKVIRFAKRNGGKCTARDAGRVGAGGGSSDEVEKVMEGIVAAGLAEWETPARPEGGRPTRYFRLKSIAGPM